MFGGQNKFRGVLTGVFILSLAVGINLELPGRVWADLGLISGGAGEYTNCADNTTGYCYSDRIWTYYKFGDTASGNISIGTNYWNHYSSLGYPVATVNVDDCKAKNAEGFWVLQYVTTLVNHREVRSAFGASSINNLGRDFGDGEVGLVDVGDMSGILYDGGSGYPSTVAPIRFSDDLGEIQAIYNSYYSGAGELSWSSFANSSYKGFCGSASVSSAPTRSVAKVRASTTISGNNLVYEDGSNFTGIVGNSESKSATVRAKYPGQQSLAIGHQIVRSGSGPSGVSFRTYTKDCGSSCPYAGYANRAISGGTSGSSSSWTNYVYSSYVYYNSNSCADVSGKTVAWNAYYEGSTKTGNGAKKRSIAKLCIKGPIKRTATVSGGITIKVNDSTVSGGDYYATSNTLSFTVQASYSLVRGNDSLGGLNIAYAAAYREGGLIPDDPTSLTSTSWNLASGGTNNITGTSVTVNLAYGETRTVCYKLRYGSSYGYNATAGEWISSSPELISSTYKCVTIHAPEKTVAKFEMNNLQLTIDANLRNTGSNQYSGGVAYSMLEGTGIQKTYTVGPDSFSIKRIDNNTVPSLARSLYKTTFRSGIYNSSISTGSGLDKATDAGALAVLSENNNQRLSSASLEKNESRSYTNSIGSYDIESEIGTSNNLSSATKFCVYGAYSNEVTYISWWQYNYLSIYRSSAVSSGGDSYNGRRYKCYAVYNPSAQFVALFSASSTVSSLTPRNSINGPQLEFETATTGTQVTAKLDNQKRNTNGDDAGRYRYTFEDSGSTCDGQPCSIYSASFTHQITLTNDEIAAWMKKNNNENYRSIYTNFRIEESYNGGSTYSVLDIGDGSGFSTASGFTQNNKSPSGAKRITAQEFKYVKNADFSIGKYINYCQRISYYPQNTYKTIANPILSGKEYGIDGGTLGGTISSSGQACVTIKNPRYIESDGSAQHQIDIRGFTQATGVNYSTGNYTAGYAGAIACDSNNLSYISLLANGNCLTNQYNMLESSANTYFAHDIFRYDISSGTSFDETDSSVITSGFSQNFWPEACLKLQVDNSAQRNSVSCERLSSGAIQKNTIYAYSNAANADDDPFAVSVSYKGNEKLANNSWQNNALPVLQDLSSSGKRLRLQAAIVRTGSNSYSSSSPNNSYYRSGKTLDSLSELTGQTTDKFGLGQTGGKQILAGQTLEISQANRVSPSQWTVNYAKIERCETYDNTSNRTCSFDRYELRSKQTGAVYNSSYDAQDDNHQDTIHLHRDWNYRIAEATYSASGSAGSPSNLINAGGAKTVDFNLKITRDNEIVTNSLGQTSGWKAIDGAERNFITELNSNKTQVSLVLYSMLPYEELTEGVRASYTKDNYHNDLGTLINGVLLAGDGISQAGNYCQYFAGTAAANHGALGECVDIYSVGDGSDAKWGTNSSAANLTWGESWGYSDGIGINGNSIGLRISPSEIKHDNTGGFNSSGESGAKETNVGGAVSLADNYNLKIKVDGIRSFQMTTGAKFCMALAIQDLSSTSHDILISESSCQNVTKNPQFSVWGGDVVTDGGIKTSMVQSNGMFYGSWGDFGLIASDHTIKHMSSGRAVKGGIAVNDGLTKENFAPLTLTNIGASDSWGRAGVSGLSYSRQSANDGGLASRWQGNTDQEVCIIDRRSSASISITGKDWFDANTSGCGGRQRLVILANEVKLAGDIRLWDGTDAAGNSATGIFGALPAGGLSSASEVAQITILASGDVKVKDVVQRVEAWLIASGNINTCAYGEDVQNFTVGGISTSSTTNIAKLNCTRKLELYGPVVAASIQLRRTQGGDSMDNIDYLSGQVEDTCESTVDEVAEQIDMNPGALLFSIAESKDIAPETSYLRSLVPRY